MCGFSTGCAASFENLRTQGGFLVSASGRRDEVKAIRIDSTVGGPLRVLSPWEAMTVRINGGARQRPALDDEGIAEIPTKPGDQIELSAG